MSKSERRIIIPWFHSSESSHYLTFIFSLFWLHVKPWNCYKSNVTWSTRVLNNNISHSERFSRFIGRWTIIVELVFCVFVDITLSTHFTYHRLLPFLSLITIEFQTGLYIILLMFYKTVCRMTHVMLFITSDIRLYTTHIPQICQSLFLNSKKPGYSTVDFLLSIDQIYHCSIQY